VDRAADRARVGVTGHRIMLAITKMIVHLALQGGFDHHFGQPAQQATLSGQLQTLGPGPIDQLPYQLLVLVLQG
jgi:hypothetical protein